MNQPQAPFRFSFVIPVLNEEECLAACVQSIRAQSSDELEIIVVDNGSTDRTMEIAQALGCRLAREEQAGLSHARNRGAGVAQGEIVCFIDADGVLAEGWLKAVQACFADPKVGAVSGLSIYRHPNPLKEIYYNLYTFGVAAGASLSNLLFSRMFFTGNNLAIRRTLFQQIGGYDPVIGEGMWLSRRFWELPGWKGRLCPRMILWNSPRGFEHKGFLRTVAYWVTSSILRRSQTGYTYKTRSPGR